MWTGNLNARRKDLLRIHAPWEMSPRLLADSGSPWPALCLAPLEGQAAVQSSGPRQREPGALLCPLSQPERSETNAQDKSCLEIAFRALCHVNSLSELTPKAC